MELLIKKNIAAALAVAANFPKTRTIRLAKYDSEATYAAFVADSEALPWRDHCRIVRETASALRAAGYKVLVINVTEEGYRAWLGEDLNTTEARARYAAEAPGEDGEAAR